MKIDVEWTDLGLEALVEKVTDAGRLSVACGVVGGAENTVVDEAGTTLGDVALFNQFGTRDIPARPFLDAPIREPGKVLEEFANAARLIVGGASNVAALNRVGEFGKAEIVKAIDSAQPANAPSTIRKKGADSPLRDTYQLRSSISYEVVRGGVEDEFSSFDISVGEGE